MSQSTWQQFGLKADPFDTYPLAEGGDIPIDDAFVGREEEILSINRLFASQNNVALTICGNVGVGKTSLANFQKWNWKFHKEKLLFSFRREIEASEELLTKRNFLMEIIASVL